jgi:hypothetical protein
MNNPNFAELREKLCQFKKIDEMTINWQNGALWQFEKSAAIITELLEIIQTQSEALEKIQEYESVPTYVRVQYRAVLTTDFVNKALSETNTRLQKLREGKNG